MTTNNNAIAINVLDNAVEAIRNNRFIAGAQLTADDMGKNEWTFYRNVCDSIAIESYRYLTSNREGTNLGGLLSRLFRMFGCNAKLMGQYIPRVAVACVAVKRNKSVTLKNKEKALRDAKALLQDFQTHAVLHAEMVKEKGEDVLVAINGTYYNTVSLQKEVEKLEDLVKVVGQEVDDLYNQPGNCWYDYAPQLDVSKKHASVKCRKLIEDLMADILTEREFMTVEDLQREAAMLKAQRDAARKNKQAAK